MYLIGMLVLLFLANVAMLMGMTNWPQRTREGFMNYLMDGGFGTASIGPYDTQDMRKGLNNPESQGFIPAKRANRRPTGAPFVLDNDHLLPFSNNVVSPDCCGATLTCDGGCICTTPEQRDFINMRGGNRKHEDGF
jgi:hypothetical protein